MTAHPLKKKIYERAKELGITDIILRFSGGSDEGYLDVELSPYLERSSDKQQLADDIEEWAWEVYSYSGAGEGTEYGDNITYDLENNQVSCQEWYHVRQDESPTTLKLDIDED